MIQRILHDKDSGTWLKEYKHTNPLPNMSRYSLDHSSFMVYSVKLKINGNGEVEVEFPTSSDSSITEVRFGQHFVPQRNLQLFTKFHYDFDISVNKAEELDTNSATDTINIISKISKKKEDVIASIILKFTELSTNKVIEVSLQSLLKSTEDSPIRLDYGKRVASKFTPNLYYHKGDNKIVIKVGDTSYPYTPISLDDGTVVSGIVMNITGEGINTSTNTITKSYIDTKTLLSTYTQVNISVVKEGNKITLDYLNNPHIVDNEILFINME